MRLFIAVPLPKNVQRAVWTVEESLRQAGATGRFVPQGNHHITVRYLGETDALADVAAAMHEAVCDAKPFLLRLGAIDYFVHSGTKTCVLNVGGETQEFFRIYETLEESLLDRGFVRGRGKPTPHITLAQGISHPEGLTLPVPGETFTARSIVLYESRSERGRMVYLPLHSETF